jgi:galactokinase/mevalonate kinase-like predicted kinase
MDDALETVGEMKQNAYDLAEAFAHSDLAAVSKAIQAQQDLKQKLPGKFTDEYVEDVVRRVHKHGAGVQLPGGKIGAFLMVCCPDGQQAAIREEFKEFREVSLGLSDPGSTVIEM